MRQNLLSFLSAVLLIAGLPVVAEAVNYPVEAQYELRSVRHSLQTKTSKTDVRVEIDLPDGSSLLARTILKDIKDYLAVGQMNGKRQPLAVSDKSNLVAEAVKQNSAYLQKSFDELTQGATTEEAKEMQEYYANVQYVRHIGATKIVDTPQYVTYKYETYMYEGGAHGMTFRSVTTYLKPNGKKLGNIVDKTKLRQLQKLLANGLSRYFKKSGYPDMTPAKVRKELFFTKGIIPLPSGKPYLVKRGVAFVYQQYEIGPYAIGMPTFVIPYKNIYPYLTPEGKKIVTPFLQK
ncbi:MAG: DUF3298 domain-containing protein [Prevotella sp.]|nr:DUF3298 domain-containing protein [Prevotellaceae bacterium]MDY3935707.1 DUF3298 domain-containing protein [Prevotella sp.]